MAAATEVIRMKNPAHPGGFVKLEIIEPLGLSVTEGARLIGVTRAAFSAFLNERADLSPDMAIRIDKAFIGSCTNSRLDDLRAASQVVRGRKVADGVHAIVTPGSGLIRELHRGIVEEQHQIVFGRIAERRVC